jgi:hypothetical protein
VLWRLAAFPIVGAVLGWRMPDLPGSRLGFYFKWLIGAVMIFFLLQDRGFFTIGTALPCRRDSHQRNG